MHIHVHTQAHTHRHTYRHTHRHTHMHAHTEAADWSAERGCAYVSSSRKAAEVTQAPCRSRANCSATDTVSQSACTHTNEDARPLSPSHTQHKHMHTHAHAARTHCTHMYTYTHRHIRTETDTHTHTQTHAFLFLSLSLSFLVCPCLTSVSVSFSTWKRKSDTDFIRSPTSTNSPRTHREITTVPQWNDATVCSSCWPFSCCRHAYTNTYRPPRQAP
jgi:hypothetical protein